MLDDLYIRECLLAALEAARMGGEVLVHYWGKLSGYQTKGSLTDLVTVADHESDRTIVGHLKNLFPEHAFIAEESGQGGASGAPFTWMIDPLDGTTNYTHQYPMVSVSIALMHKSQPIVGVVYNPILNEKFSCAKGCGATLNNLPIHVSKIGQLNKSLLGTGFAYDRKETKDNNYAEFCHMTNESQGVRRGGSAALDLAYVAAGRFDGFWERGLQSWDMAAGALLVQEAGGRISAYDGSPWDYASGRILATNGLIHDLIIKELMKFRSTGAA